MNEYIEQYYSLLINSNDLKVIEELLPSIILDKTNEILKQLISKLTEETKMAEEFNDTEYLLYLK